MSDNVNHPAHYTQGDIECIYAIKSALGNGFEAFCCGNAIKYIWRHNAKGGVEDLKKAQWYLSRVIDEHAERAKMVAQAAERAIDSAVRNG